MPRHLREQATHLAYPMPWALPWIIGFIWCTLPPAVIIQKMVIFSSRCPAMDASHTQLIAAARAVCGVFRLSAAFSAGSVGAALRTAQGTIYTGVCIDLACGLGFCAEVAAVAEMVKSRETHIVAMVAVSSSRILPPCGRCREMLVQVDGRNLDCQVLLGEERAVALRELLPDHWLAHHPSPAHGSA